VPVPYPTFGSIASKKMPEKPAWKSLPTRTGIASPARNRRHCHRIVSMGMVPRPFRLLSKYSRDQRSVSGPGYWCVGCIAIAAQLGPALRQGREGALLCSKDDADEPPPAAKD
jgi:hypothetical protein